VKFFLYEIVIQAASWSLDGYPFIVGPLSPNKCFDNRFVLSVQVDHLLILHQTYAQLTF
jgi:hypothetical protein